MQEFFAAIDKNKAGTIIEKYRTTPQKHRQRMNNTGTFDEKIFIQQIVHPTHTNTHSRSKQEANALNKITH
jgi:hypothetical protein